MSIDAVTLSAMAEATDHSDDLRQAALGRLWTLADMAASLSHDAAQPLNIIRLLSEGALDQLARAEPNRARLERAFTNIMDQCQRLQELLDSLRTSTKAAERPAVSFDPAQLIVGCLSGLRERLEQENILLHWAADPGCPAVIGRPDLLEQSLNNLFSNACNALGGAPATGAPRRLWVSCLSEDADVVITVEDNGPGLPAWALERFQRPLPITPPPAKGGGLGLAIASGLIAAMGGKFQASNTRTGALLVIRLPAAEQGVRQ